MTPGVFRRRVLVVLSGLSPQVITETIYGLAVGSDPQWIPTDVHLLTTTEGAERARLSLLGPAGWLTKLCREYSLRAMSFEVHTIELNGEPVADIRTSRENCAAADKITNVIRECTGDPSSAVHVSIAGGRKSMGFYAGSALALFGRPQDRLSHVLVDPRFESHPNFFYPTRKRNIIYTGSPDSRPLDTSAAVVTMADIPFVRLRQWLPDAALQETAGWRETVAAAQQEIDASTLSFSPADCTIHAGDTQLALPRAEFAFYYWIARRSAQGGDALTCPSEAGDEVLAREYLACLREAGGDSFSRTAKALGRGMDKDFFLQRRSRVNRLLTEGLRQSSTPYLIAASGKRPETRYGLRLPSENVRLPQPSTDDATPRRNN